MSLKLTFLDCNQTFHMLLHAGLGQTAGAAGSATSPCMQPWFCRACNKLTKDQTLTLSWAARLHQACAGRTGDPCFQHTGVDPVMRPTPRSKHTQMILRDPLIPSSQVLGRCSLSEARLPTTPPLLALRGMLGISLSSFLLVHRFLSLCTGLLTLVLYCHMWRSFLYLCVFGYSTLGNPLDELRANCAILYS